MDTTYTLTEAQATIYDDGGDEETGRLMRELRAEFEGTGTEVVHPDGFVVEMYPLID